jgi:hypothetical protein
LWAAGQPREPSRDLGADLRADQTLGAYLGFELRGDLHEVPAQAAREPDTLVDELVAVVVQDPDLVCLLVEESDGLRVDSFSERCAGDRGGIEEALSVLDGEAVTMLAATDHSIALVLRLVDEMLAGDEEIDWGAAYSALEIIEQDLHERGMNGQDLGWWTAKERGTSEPRRTASRCSASTPATASRSA